jgi:hypothetical protein
VAQDAPETVLLSTDEAWMYLQATTMDVWSPRGQTPITRVDPGRKKVGFYGTLNLRTGEQIVARSDVFNSAATARYLQQILDTFPDQPILLLWDRAPWHHGDAVGNVLAANPRLEIMWFPVASPDLNPQEMVWKKTRRAVSHNHLVPKLPQLADRFEDHLLNNTFPSSFLDRYGFNTIYSILN